MTPVRCIATKPIAFFQFWDGHVPYPAFAVSTRKQKLALVVCLHCGGKSDFFLPLFQVGENFLWQSIVGFQ